MDALRRLAQEEQQAPPPGPLAEVPYDSSFDDFLALFEDLRGLAPSSFFLLFKIARIIKTPNAKIAGQLKGFFDICQSSDRTGVTENQAKKSLAEAVPVLSGHDPHFGIRRTTGVEEVSSAQPTDVAIEDFTELLRKAEEKQLNIRVLVRDGPGQAAMETAPIRDRGSREMVNSAEQKLYILLDRSYSMWHRERMLYAKLLAIEYLRSKKRTGARLFFRCFDFEVYPVETLNSPEDYDSLIRRMLFVEPGGKGTDIGLAIEVAAKDIHRDGMYEGAEILLITDGMDRIEADHIKEVLGSKTKLHMLKIGRDANEPQPSELKDMIAKDPSIAGLGGEQVAELYKRQISRAWEQVSETLLETDDIDDKDLRVGDPEVDFVVRAVELMCAVEPKEMALAEAETAYRKASFFEGFAEMLLSHADGSEAVDRRKGELTDALQKLRAYKVRVAAKSGIAANLLAARDIHFVADKTLRKQAKKAKLSMDDLARFQESQDLMIKLRLGGPEGDSELKGEGLSIWKLMGMIAKSAARSVSGWLFTGAKEQGEAAPPETTGKAGQRGKSEEQQPKE
jgi:Mg-chelatase subunit ChlD